MTDVMQSIEAELLRVAARRGRDRKWRSRSTVAALGAVSSVAVVAAAAALGVVPADILGGADLGPATNPAPNSPRASTTFPGSRGRVWRVTTYLSTDNNLCTAATLIGTPGPPLQVSCGDGFSTGERQLAGEEFNRAMVRGMGDNSGEALFYGLAGSDVSRVAIATATQTYPAPISDQSVSVPVNNGRLTPGQQRRVAALPATLPERVYGVVLDLPASTTMASLLVTMKDGKTTSTRIEIPGTNDPSFGDPHSSSGNKRRAG